MADRWALVIATDNYLDPGWSLVPFAESGAGALSEPRAATAAHAVREALTAVEAG